MAPHPVGCSPTATSGAVVHVVEHGELILGLFTFHTQQLTLNKELSVSLLDAFHDFGVKGLRLACAVREQEH